MSGGFESRLASYPFRNSHPCTVIVANILCRLALERLDYPSFQPFLWLVELAHQHHKAAHRLLASVNLPQCTDVVATRMRPYHSRPSAISAVPVAGIRPRRPELLSIRSFCFESINTSQKSFNTRHPPPNLRTFHDVSSREACEEDLSSPSRESAVEPKPLGAGPSYAEPSYVRFDWRKRAPSRLRTAPREHKGVYSRRCRPSLNPLAVGDRYFAEIENYTNRFLPMIQAEQEEGQAAIKTRLSTWSLERLQQEGYCLIGLSAFWLESHDLVRPRDLFRPKASFFLGPGVKLPQHHRFEIGTQVMVSRDHSFREDPIRASVVECTDTKIILSFCNVFNLDNTQWRIDLADSDVVYERMRTAIKQLCHDPAKYERKSDLILQGTYLRDILLKHTLEFREEPTIQPSPDDMYPVSHEGLDHASRLGERGGGAFQDDMRIQSWAKRYSKPNPLVAEGDPVLHLNASQIKAIAIMIGERMTLVQGPPGTGKTRTIVETVKLLKTHFEVVHPILICTYTNTAVDNLVEGLAKVGVKPLRIGYGGKVKTSVFEHSLEPKLSKHPLKPKVSELESQAEQHRTSIRDLSKKINQPASETTASPRSEWSNSKILEHRRLLSIESTLDALRQRMIYDTIQESDVVCTTCIASAYRVLDCVDFPVVFIDEASMSTEPASLIPLMKGSRQVALIGDHKQLPPVITSDLARDHGLGISLFERLTAEGDVASVMLDVQYRMHPTIAMFPSSEFYNLTVLDGTVDSAGNIHPSLMPPASSHLLPNPETGHTPPVVFLDHNAPESYRDRSRVNKTEANIVCRVIEDLLLFNDQLQGSDIGILAPYAAQVSLLKRMLKTDAKCKEMFQAVLGNERALQMAEIEVRTIDGFEGREKDIIIFSTVRNNESGYIGFLADRRRLNVGLTRAKRGLFVVGSLNTLRIGKGGGGPHFSALVRVDSGADTWRRYTEFLIQHGLVVPLTGERLDALLGHRARAG